MNKFEKMVIYNKNQLNLLMVFSHLSKMSPDDLAKAMTIRKSRTIETIMTGGSFSEIGTIIPVLGFVLLRTTIVFILPGFILSWLCLELIDFLLEKRRMSAKL